MNDDINAMLDRFENTTANMVGNMVGLPLLACRIAQNAVIIKNDPNIRTEKQVNDFLIDDLASYSKKLKDENCLGYMFVDKYIEYLNAI
ncbi:MAG: hypothetical protein WBF67_05330 [Olleya sp.]